jgi:hypothetical protein
MMIDAAEPRRPSSRPPRTTAAKSPVRDGDGRPEKPAIELVLYVSSVSPHSTAALRNVRRTLAQYGGPVVKLTVHDLSKDPQRADRDGVHFTPALVTKGNGPRTWIVGHLGNPQVLQALLDSALEPPE